MRKLFVLPWLMFLFLLSSCSTVQEYPRCFLFRAPTDKELSAINTRDNKLLADIFSTEKAWTGRDSVYAKALPYQQNNIKNIWHTSGCINMRRSEPLNSEIIDKWIVARCHEYLAEYVANNQNDFPVKPSKIAAKYDEFICH